MIDLYFLTGGWEWALFGVAETLVFLLFIRPVPGKLLFAPSRWLKLLFMALLLAFVTTLKMFSPPFFLDATLKIAAWSLYLYAAKGLPWSKGAYLSSVIFLTGDFSRLFVLKIVMERWLYNVLVSCSPSFITNTHTVLIFLAEMGFLLVLRPAVLRDIQRDLGPGQNLSIVFPVVPYIVVRYAQFGWLPDFLSGNVTDLIACIMAFCTILMLIFNEQNQAALLRRMEAMNEQMLERERSQYLVKKDMMEDFNRKYHDFKHYLNGLLALDDAEEMKRYIYRIQSEMEPYHVAYETGNSIVNAILSEKMLLCKRKGIILEPDIDARRIGFVSSLDLCTIFGNGLDNAIEAVDPLQDADRRIIVRVKTVRQMIAIHIQNPYDGSLKVEKGRFLTTKNNTLHLGAGIGNMQNAVQRYGGSMAFDTSGENSFVLNILIPVPAAG